MAADPDATCTVHTIHLILNLNPKNGLTNPICCQVNRFIVTLFTMLPWMMCEGRKKPEQQEGVGGGGGGGELCFTDYIPSLGLSDSLKLLMMHESQRALSKLRRVFAPNWPQVRRPALVWFGIRSYWVRRGLMFVLVTGSQCKCLCVHKTVAGQ